MFEIQISIISFIFLCCTENNKIRTFWGWNPSKNENIESHQNTIYLIKKFIIITNTMSSMYIWVENHLLLTQLIFFETIKKKYDSSAKFLCTHFFHQTFYLYIIDIPFSSFLFFQFFLFFSILFSFSFKPLATETASTAFLV